MKELTLEQKRACLRYIKSYIKNAPTIYIHICNIYVDWYTDNINKDFIETYSLVCFPELLISIKNAIKRNEDSAYRVFRLNHNTKVLDCSAIHRVDNKGYRLKLLKRVEKKLNDKYGTTNN